MCDCIPAQFSGALSASSKPRQVSGAVPSGYGFTPKGKRRGRRPLAASRALPELSLANQPPPTSLHGSELGVLARLVALYDCIISRTVCISASVSFISSSQHLILLAWFGA